MQRVPQESSQTLPFTYCLFLDDHFPSELQVTSEASQEPQTSKPSLKSGAWISETRTQVSFIAEAPADVRRDSKEHSPVRAGFLSTKESGSDCDTQDFLMLSSDEEMLGDRVDSLRVSGSSWGYRDSDHPTFCEGETTSLELSRSLVTLEHKSGFSIWSCISPDLGFSQDLHSNGPSSKKRSAKVSTAKLRRALGKTHFERIEAGLRKLLNRKKSRD
jgi:hypothetical protein